MSYATLHNVRHRAPILMIAVLGTALSITSWYIVSGLEDRTSAAEFNLRASNMAAALQNGVNEYFTKMYPLRAMIESSPDAVSEQEFGTFSNRLLRDESAILSLSWIPRIRNEERAVHEQAARREGIDGYRIRSVSKDNALEPSPAAAEYFPVYYTTEKTRVDLVQGVNLADSGIRQQPLESARDGDMLAASQKFTLQSGTGDRIGFFVVLPIYKRGLPHNSVEERRRNLVGFVQGVFQIDAMIGAILHGIRTSADYYIFTSEAGSSTRLIYTSLPKPSGEPLAASSRAEF